MVNEENPYAVHTEFFFARAGVFKLARFPLNHLEPTRRDIVQGKDGSFDAEDLIFEAIGHAHLIRGTILHRQA